MQFFCDYANLELGQNELLRSYWSVDGFCWRADTAKFFALLSAFSSSLHYCLTTMKFFFLFLRVIINLHEIAIYDEGFLLAYSLSQSIECLFQIVDTSSGVIKHTPGRA